jgi:signal transduction histidine kinase
MDTSLNLNPSYPPSHVLLVEDNSVDRKVLSRRLRQEGYGVEHALNGEEALRKIRDGGFDLVLLDIIMPRLSGFEVLREARRAYPMDRLPIIMVTAEDNSDYMVKALMLGANDYLIKRMSPQVALARIAAQLSLKRLAATSREFLNAASRDLQQPLALLQHHLESLMRDQPPGAASTADSQERLTACLRTVASMQHVVQGLLEIGSIETGRIQINSRYVDLNTLAHQVVAANAYYAGQKQHTLQLDLHPQLPPVWADEARLLQVMDNLIGNAIKFSPPGGQSTLRTRPERAGVLFEVTDRGPGLTPIDLEQIFAGHFSCLSNTPTGGETSARLGLTICKQLIDLLGGEIGVYNNTSGPGATFWFRLPLQPFH